MLLVYCCCGSYNAGSIQRRIMVIRFEEKVVKGNPDLQEKLAFENEACGILLPQVLSML